MRAEAKSKVTKKSYETNVATPWGFVLQRGCEGHVEIPGVDRRGMGHGRDQWGEYMMIFMGFWPEDPLCVLGVLFAEGGAEFIAGAGLMGRWGSLWTLLGGGFARVLSGRGGCTPIWTGGAEVVDEAVGGERWAWYFLAFGS